MIIKVAANNDFTLIQICGNNGEPASPQNPIDEATELGTIDFPVITGKLLIVSGMPASAQCACVAHYKNLFGGVGLLNARLGVAFIIHSVAKEYKMGDQIPL